MSDDSRDEQHDDGGGPDDQPQCAGGHGPGDHSGQHGRTRGDRYRGPRSFGSERHPQSRTVIMDLQIYLRGKLIGGGVLVGGRCGLPGLFHRFGRPRSIGVVTCALRLWLNYCPRPSLC